MSSISRTQCLIITDSNAENKGPHVEDPRAAEPYKSREKKGEVTIWGSATVAGAHSDHQRFPGYGPFPLSLPVRGKRARSPADVELPASPTSPTAPATPNSAKRHKAEATAPTVTTSTTSTTTARTSTAVSLQDCRGEDPKLCAADAGIKEQGEEVNKRENEGDGDVCEASARGP